MVSRRVSRPQASFSELTENFDCINMQTENEAAPQAASARRASASQPIWNPFSSAPEPAQSPTADSNVSMEYVSGMVLNAPSLPTAPMYRGSTFGEHRTFMRAYGRYTAALAAVRHLPIDSSSSWLARVLRGILVVASRCSTLGISRNK